MKRPPRPSRRPRLRTLLLFLLLGAAVNVAVAWGSAVMVGFADVDVRDWNARGYRAWADGISSTTVWNRFAAKRISYVSTGDSWRGGEIVSEGPEPDDLIPCWMNVSRHLESDQNDLFCEIEARGAPLLTFWSTTLFNEKFANQDKAVRHGPSGSIPLPVAKFTGAMGSIPRVLPLHPIWPGFAINTVFYAAVCWLLFAAPFAVRRRRRIKRGLCPACAYPVGASDLCTECGKPVTATRPRGAPLA